MFDIGAIELLVVVVVAIIVIGPKDMPAALRHVGRWVGKIRRVSAQFRSGFDEMVREAEMEEMDKKWKAQNDQIMAANPGVEMEPSDVGRGYADSSDELNGDDGVGDTTESKPAKSDTASDEPPLPFDPDNKG